MGRSYRRALEKKGLLAVGATQVESRSLEKYSPVEDGHPSEMQGLLQ